MKRFLLLSFLAFHCAVAAEHQLNVEGFSHCLAQESDAYRLKALKKEEHFFYFDLLTPYLAFYPGQDFGLFRGRLRQKAQRRWMDTYHEYEAMLAQSIVGLAKASKHEGRLLYPNVIFSEALAACGGRNQVFCAALVSHNVLRTFGRWKASVKYAKGGQRSANFNPLWFQDNENFWVQQIPGIQKQMVSLRVSGQGDRWGEWYHFFGLMTFSLREMARAKHLVWAKLSVRANAFVTWLLSGGRRLHEERLQLDKDAVRVSYLFMTKTAVDMKNMSDCSNRSDYVLE